uniref:Sucrose phosphatase-like domain-containing protein n=2 Tax=Odontella aurita TaxID=265563 RepID=A0A7S4JHC1_9STRA|mmetsp:Transcript_46522/g.140952  ORF Transcript_46522/g.140952 Transcript_46522/m.140952 type:complete len:271 (+) Transcript_46522:193-1005(+)
MKTGWYCTLLGFLVFLLGSHTIFASMDGGRLFKIVFSDVDGTLVHYDDISESASSNSEIIQLPPSSTGMRGIISTDTLRLCHKLRSSHGSKLVLVSGMRTTTLLKRLPFLPRADAYASEAGSRVFYPVNLAKEASYQGTIIRPERYDGVSDSDLASFGIKEDMEWRAKMELRNAAGGDGYVQRDRDVDVLSRRSGLLWDHARRLESKGFVIDFHGYAACFRVNRKQQKEDQTKGEAFDALLKSSPPEGLACSVNLGCIDFYPEASGKKNW